jgi:hypothetical protein
VIELRGGIVENTSTRSGPLQAGKNFSFLGVEFRLVDQIGVKHRLQLL